MPNAKPIPDGYHSITPYLSHKNADAAIKFYERAFGAKEIMRLSTPEGGVAHAEIEVGDSRVMLADEMPAYGNKSAETLGGSPVSFLFYVEDVDAAFERAVKAGAKVKRPVEDQFYGDRVGTVIDPFGVQWSIGTHKEEVTQQEMQRRMEKMFSS
ncbi:MAG: VOC family protein [Acidobacteriaceae bacterium]|nr:VOC family protein [Acidobacteriaceae bacterium]